MSRVILNSFFAYCLLSTVNCFSQPYFAETFGETGTDIARSVQQTLDGGYIITGYTTSFGAGAEDVYLIKTDANGDTLWTKAFGETGDDRGYSVQLTIDGGYIIAGYTNSFGAGGDDVYLIKIDANSNFLWSKTYGGINGDVAYSVQQTVDGGYIITGNTESFGVGNPGSGFPDVYLLKTDSMGDTLWTKTYGGTNSDFGWSVQQTTDLGYVIVGYTNSFGAGAEDVYLIKTDASGDTLWTKTFGGTGGDYGYSVQQTADGGFIITGYTASFGTPGSNDNVYLIKTDLNGVLQWSKEYEGPGNPGPPDPGNDYGYSVLQNSLGGYAITGSTTSNGVSGSQAYLLITDNNGIPVDYARTYGLALDNESLYSVQQTSDGGYVMAGSTESYGAGALDIFLVKTDSIGDNGIACGSGGMFFIDSIISTIESSTATLVGSGATVTSPATIVSSTATLSTQLPLGVLVTVTNVSCYGGSDGQAIATPKAGSAPYTYNWIPSGGIDSIETGLSAGTYILQVIDAFGCQQPDQTVIITEPDSIVLTTTIDSMASCGGSDSSGVLIVNLIGGTSPYDYFWSSGSITLGTTATSDTATGLPSGTYTVAITDANGCTATDTVSFGMTFSTGTVDANCTTPNGSASVSVTGGTQPYTYLWNDPANQTTDTATGLEPGVYTVVVTDSSGCQDSIAVTVNSIFGGPDITIDSVINVNCSGGSDGAIYITITDGIFGLPPYSILWSNADTTDDIINLSAGTYIVEVTEDLTGCVTSAIVILTEPPLALSADITDSSDVACFGVNDGFATVTASGSGPFTYSWSPSGGTGSTATGLSAGTHTVTVTDVDGCTAMDSVIITGPLAALALTIDTNSASCGVSDAKAWVTVTGGTGAYTYLWSPGLQTTDTIINLSIGTYTVVVTDSNGCQDSATATIIESGAPVITIDSIIDVSCNGGNDGAIYITASGSVLPYTYSWSPSGGTDSAATGLAAGTYTVTVTDVNNCSVIDSADVTEPSAINISSVSSTNITCNGGNDGTITITASGGTGTLSYSIDSGITYPSITGIFTVLGAGSYVIAVQDANGCIQIDSTLVITDPPAINITLETSEDITCNGFNDGTITIIATGGTGILNYSIDGGVTFPNATGIFTGLGSGSYGIAVQDANGCIQTGSTLTINEPAAITIISLVPTDVTSCGGSDGTITITATGGTGALQDSITGYSYQPDGTVFPGLTVGNYGITVQDSNGCTLDSTVTINDPGTVSIDLEVFADITCFGFDDGTITITASGGTGSLSYSIDGGITYQSSDSFDSLSANTYDILVQDAISCMQAGSTITINEPPAIIISSELSTNITCNGDGNGTITITASGGTGTLSYSIDSGFTYQGSGSFSSLSASIYNVMVQDSNGCTQPGSIITIIEPAAINIDSVVSTDVASCGGSDGTITITASGGTAPLEYSIDGGGNYQSNGNFANLSQGTYNVEVRDANGCTQIFGSSITINDPSAVVLTSVVDSNVTCNSGSDGGATVSVTGGSSPYTYSWSPSGGIDSVAVGLAAGTYTVSVTDANGCSANDIITITEPDSIDADITVNDPTLGQCDGEAMISVSGGTQPYTYQWDTATGSQTTATASDLCGGTYNIIVTDASGCTNTFSVELTAPPNEFFLPTAFAPDGDDPENKKLKIRGGNIQSILLVIYDRWGEKVFEASNVSEAEKGWDGTFRNNGKPLNSDSYPYYLEVTVGGEEIIQTGDIVLVR